MLMTSSGNKKQVKKVLIIVLVSVLFFCNQHTPMKTARFQKLKSDTIENETNHDNIERSFGIK